MGGGNRGGGGRKDVPSEPFPPESSLPANAGKLGPKKERAIIALLSQRSVEEAARVIGVSTRTLYRWMKQLDFSAAYLDARKSVYFQSMSRLHQMANPAVTTLGRALVDPSTPMATKVRAADKILEHGANAIELEDIYTRLVKVERTAEVLKTQIPQDKRRKTESTEED
jgi:transposase-like protein